MKIEEQFLDLLDLCQIQKDWYIAKELDRKSNFNKSYDNQKIKNVYWELWWSSSKDLFLY